MKPAIVKPAIVKLAAVVFSECGAEAAAMDAAKSAGMEPTTVETAASAMKSTAAVGASPAMRFRMGEIWLAERGKAQQGGCGGT